MSKYILFLQFYRYNSKINVNKKSFKIGISFTVHSTQLTVKLFMNFNILSGAFKINY
jgi:hypothetical protein